MKQIVQQLPIGKLHQGMDLYATVQVEGQRPERFKCDSFLGAFVRELYGLMAGGAFPRPSLMGGFSSSGPATSNDTITQIGSIYTNGSDEIYIQTPYDNFRYGNEWDEPNPQQVYLFGVEGIPEANGVHFMEKIADDEAYLVDSSGARKAATGTYVGGTGRIITYQNFAYRNGAGPEASLFQWRVIVGSGSAAVKASDIALSRRLQNGTGANQLVPGNTTTYGAQTTDKPSSRMTLTRSFTNNSGGPIDINEIGIVTSTSPSEANTDFSQFLIVRDVLDSTRQLPAGKSITIDYEIVFRLAPDTQNTDADGTNGGFLQVFVQLLRDILTDTEQYYKRHFNMGMPGAIGNPTRNDDLVGWTFGPRLGTDNTFTSMTDTAMLGPIDHGGADGQLWYHGTSFDRPVIDDQANEAYFSVFRIFQNRGSTPITIAEMGLFGNPGIDDAIGFTSSPALLSRTALAPADQITVQPGEYVLGKYIVKAVV